MITATIAQGVIKVAVQGMAALQAQLAQVQKGFAATASAAAVISSSGTNAFSTATASIRELVRAADPYGFRQYEMAVARLTVQMGRFFIPLLRDVTSLVGRTTEYFRSLSDSTRDSVLTVSKWTLAALGAVAAAGLLSGFLFSVAGTFARLIPLALLAVKAIAGVALALNPWVSIPLAIAGVAAAFIGLREAGGDVGVLFAAVGRAGAAAWEGIKAVWGELAAFFEPHLAKLGTAFSAAWGRISALVADSLGRLTPKLEAFGAKAGELLGQGIGIAAKLAVAGLEGLAKLLEWTADLLEAAWPYAERLFGSMLDRAVQTGVVLQAAGKIAVEAWDGAQEKLGQFVAWCGRAFDAVRKLALDISATVGNALGPIWKDVKGAVDDLGDYIVQVFYRAVDKIRDALISVIEAINSVTIRANIPPIPVPARSTDPKPPPAAPVRPASPDDTPPPAYVPPKRGPDGLGFGAMGGAMMPAALVQSAMNPPRPPALPPLDIDWVGITAMIRAAAGIKGPPGQGDEVARTKGPMGAFSAERWLGVSSKRGPGEPNRFQGQPLQEVRMLGIAEAMRQAQTATIPSPQQAAMEEILRTTRGIRDGVEKTARNTEGAGEVRGPFVLGP